ncbi:hypothetical protein [Hamadaea sp.]|uniref:hypothetical protein n=1 Tax=Hamadaea sp. TaxID=2024425 RepID=UPI0025BB7CD3|nr:hypothetical protein [Hamadaea sp.]
MPTVIRVIAALASLVVIAMQQHAQGDEKVPESDCRPSIITPPGPIGGDEPIQIIEEGDCVNVLLIARQVRDKKWRVVGQCSHQQGTIMANCWHDLPSVGSRSPTLYDVRAVVVTSKGLLTLNGLASGLTFPSIKTLLGSECLVETDSVTVPLKTGTKQ